MVKKLSQLTIKSQLTAIVRNIKLQYIKQMYYQYV